MVSAFDPASGSRPPARDLVYPLVYPTTNNRMPHAPRGTTNLGHHRVIAAARKLDLTTTQRVFCRRWCALNLRSCCTFPLDYARLGSILDRSDGPKLDFAGSDALLLTLKARSHPLSLLVRP